MRRCANCGTKIAARPENSWAPFCGERCKLIDLGKWLGEEYRVPTAPRQEGDEQDPRFDGGSGSPDGEDDSNPRLH